MPLRPALSHIGFLLDSNALSFMGPEQSPLCSRLGPEHPDSPQPLGPVPGPTQHPNEQDGAVSIILCWAGRVQSKCSLGHLLGALLHLALRLGRARVIKKQLRLVQRTRVGLWGCSCCDLSWPEPCSDQTVLCAFSLLWLWILI